MKSKLESKLKKLFKAETDIDNGYEILDNIIKFIDSDSWEKLNGLVELKMSTSENSLKFKFNTMDDALGHNYKLGFIDGVMSFKNFIKKLSLLRDDLEKYIRLRIEEENRSMRG